MPKLVTKEISDHAARSAKPKSRRYEIRDAQLRGLMLRVNPSGSKSWYVQLDRAHKRRIGDAAVLTASMARHRARDLLQRASQLRASSSGARVPALGQFLEGRYLSWIDRRNRYGKRDTLRLSAALGPLAEARIDHVGVSQLERWKLQRARQVAPTTLNRELAALQSALNCAVRWKLISDNPVPRVRRRPVPDTRPPRVLSKQERQALEAALAERDDQLAVMVLTALNTGMSRGELFRLRWKDVFFGTNAFIELRDARGYNNRNRKIPMNSLLTQELKRWKSARRRRSTLVFPSPSGGRLKSVDTGWKRLMEAAGIRGFRLCDCRHDFAARLVRSGVAMTHVAELLGHSTLTLTARYASFAPGTGKQAVERLVPRPQPPPHANSDH